MLSNNKIDPKESRSKQLKKIQEETNSILAEHAISKILKPIKQRKVLRR